MFQNRSVFGLGESFRIGGIGGRGESPVWPSGLDSLTRTGEMIKAYLKTFKEVMAEGKASLGAA